MKFRSSAAQEEPSLNITPLIDVVFLLLIFFMVTTTFDRELELNVLLPEAAGEMSEQPREIELTIDKNGNYYIDQAQVVESNLRTLKRALEKAAEGRDDPVVIIRADAKAQHQSVIRAMDASRRAGLANVSFAVQSE